MENEYIIVNKTDIQKRIEELEKSGLVREHHAERYVVYNEILSQSTPLIPEIEKAWLDGNLGCSKDYLENYISNLKFNI